MARQCILKRCNKAMLTPQIQETGAKRRIFSSARNWKQFAKEGSPSLRKAEAGIHHYADLQFRVFGESLQEHKEKGESCRRCTTSAVPSAQNQHIELENVHVHMGPDFSENLEIYKNTNFEEFQNLFDITQKLILFKQGEILNVNMIECTSPSWTRSSLAHDQAIKWAKAKARVYSDSVLCVGKMSHLADATRRWEGQVEESQQTDSYRDFFGIDGEPIEFEWNIFPGLLSLEILQKIQKRLARTRHKTLNLRILKIESSSC